jgi:hypothetical protein
MNSSIWPNLASISLLTRKFTGKSFESPFFPDISLEMKLYISNLRLNSLIDENREFSGRNREEILIDQGSLPKWQHALRASNTDLRRIFNLNNAEHQGDPPTGHAIADR